MRVGASSLRTGCARALLAAALLGAGSSPGTAQAAADPAAAALMDAVAARYRQAPSLCSDFVQRLTVPLLGQDVTGKGRFCSQRPNKFALRFTEPAGDLVVGDGTWVWIYYPSQDAQHAVRMPAADVPGGFDFYREFFQDWATKYEVTLEATEPAAGHAARRLRLVPRAGSVRQPVVVWVQPDGVLRQLRVEEENGSARTVTLTSAELTSAPPAGWFTFTPPRGVQVVGG